MSCTKSAIVSGIALSLLSSYVVILSSAAAPPALAQIDVAPEAGSEPPPLPVAGTDQVATAEKAVEDARAALRRTMASGGDVSAARRGLQTAIRHLNQVRDTAESGEKPPGAGDGESAEAPAGIPAAAPAGTAPAEPPALAPPATADRPASAPQATAEEAEPEEDPGFFQRIFGGSEAPGPAEDETAKSDDAAEETEEPGVPIFSELPPLSGPEVLAVVPGEVEVAREDDDSRVIVREGNRLRVKHDDNDRFRRKGEEIKVEEGDGDTTITTVTRDDGTEVVTVRDAGGDILQRYRRKEDGAVDMLIGDRDRDGRPLKEPDAAATGTAADRRTELYRTLPRLVVPIPANQYVVGSQGASRSQIEQALVAPPVEAIERPYALDEIRRSSRLRAKLRRIDIDTVNFDSGAATIAEDQVPDLQAIGNALADIIAEDPTEVFYIEGHTDAVGSNLSNLALSDKRAQSIAEVLTFYFSIPPENLVTQGYGEQYLKVLTAGPERQNRRASVRRITPLLVGRPLAAAQ